MKNPVFWVCAQIELPVKPTCLATKTSKNLEILYGTAKFNEIHRMNNKGAYQMNRPRGYKT